MWFYLNESYLKDAVLTIRNSCVSDFRHSHIISAAGLSRPELISVLLLVRKQWPSAKILGITELGLEVRDQRRSAKANLAICLVLWAPSILLGLERNYSESCGSVFYLILPIPLISSFTPWIYTSRLCFIWRLWSSFS